FRAEDGIRARNVTGVQTCALPISYQYLGQSYVLPYQFLYNRAFPVLRYIVLHFQNNFLQSTLLLVGPQPIIFYLLCHLYLHLYVYSSIMSPLCVIYFMIIMFFQIGNFFYRFLIIWCIFGL